MMRLGDGLAAAGRVLEGARGVARVFRPDASQGIELAHAARRAALSQFAAEFRTQTSGFDRVVNGLNRLPRPCLAFGTIGLFVYAMADPPGFSVRMVGLSVVPEPLWWLLGAIVGFYFGARELHYRRGPDPAELPEPVTSAWHVDDDTPVAERGQGSETEAETGEERDAAEAWADNPALAEWRRAAS